jgi:hypothetical protein
MRAAAPLLVCLVLATTVVGLALARGGADRFTIQARPTIVRWTEPTTVSGTLGGARPGETVTIQQQLCGQTAWQDAVETHTNDTSWSASVGAGITALYRATADGATSETVRVEQRPGVQLTRQIRTGTFRIAVGARLSFWHRKVTLQRLDRARRVWRDVRTVTLTDSGAAAGSTFVWSSTDAFRAKLPKGTALRATFPLTQGRPCYLGGYSNVITL